MQLRPAFVRSAFWFWAAGAVKLKLTHCQLIDKWMTWFAWQHLIRCCCRKSQPRS